MILERSPVSTAKEPAIAAHVIQRRAAVTNANTVFYNLTTAITMMVGRFGLAIPALALAGSFAAQQPTPDRAGTLPTSSLSFAVLLVSTAVIISALSYFPALALGPLLEHLTMIH